MSISTVEARVLRGATAPPALSARTTWTAALRWLFDRIRTELRIRRGIKELQALDDRMLADIGLRRGQIDAAARHGACAVFHDIVQRS
jgi:uncharacterized protein YjiS (DUF1127 family)